MKIDEINSDYISTGEKQTDNLLGTRLLEYRKLILWAVLIGVVGGVVATLYHYFLQGGLKLVWHVLKPGVADFLPSVIAPWLSVILVTGAGGFLVGLALWKLGIPGEISAVVDNINLEQGRLNIKQTPSMIITSLLSISFGGSAGPEAPLVQIIGSTGSWLGDRLKLRGDLVRTFTFCGMAAALGAFFGSPLGGTLFALEIPHRRGLEYYEALIPSLIAAIISFFIFDGIVSRETPLYSFHSLVQVSPSTLLQGAGLGVIGGLAAMLFIVIFCGIEPYVKHLKSRPIVLAALGGLSIGIIAVIFPADFPVTTLFWGEFQIRDIIAGENGLVLQYGTWLAVALLIFLALAKMIAVSCTLHSGFRGGFIFPLFFIGAAIGLAVSLASQNAVSPAVAMLCTMAAVNVAVTKTPVSSSIILTTLSGTSMLPVILTASVVSFLLTTRISLIRTQRSRFIGHFKIERSAEG